jgi:hypothetical protein
LIFEGESEAVACAVAGCAEEGEGFGRGHCWWWWWWWDVGDSSGGGLWSVIELLGVVVLSRLRYWKW